MCSYREKSVLKIALFPFHHGRFNHERAVAGISLPGVKVPSIIDAGVTDGYEWIEIERVHGRPAYEIWNNLSEQSQRRLLSSLVECVSALQRFKPNEQFLYMHFDNWRDHILAAFDRVADRVKSIIPESAIHRAIEFKERNAAHLAERPSVLCHGDLWFGNLIVNDESELVGIIDWDRLAMAPVDYEIDMTWRFWRYPWDFVPPEFERDFVNELNPELLVDLLRVSSADLDSVSLNARLSMLELTYRLGVVARFGWSQKHEAMIETVLTGRWATALTDQIA